MPASEAGLAKVSFRAIASRARDGYVDSWSFLPGDFMAVAQDADQRGTWG